MIAVDTSALMACILEEPEAELCKQALQAATRLLISAGTFAEVMIVAGRRGIQQDMDFMLSQLVFEVIPVTEAVAKRIGAIYAAWGKGVHPAGLNMGDCFAYDVAQQHACPLLFVGSDFARTDLHSAFSAGLPGAPF